MTPVVRQHPANVYDEIEPRGDVLCLFKDDNSRMAYVPRLHVVQIVVDWTVISGSIQILNTRGVVMYVDFDDDDAGEACGKAMTALERWMNDDDERMVDDDYAFNN